ncbi:HAMP domain-containing sensor histidine kinase [Agarivorans sp. 1_MG-2023]|uniref:HAMP domain-containing sensor histidine kinase n=1 Tax=Agarivorans sp. 1_MG-2023 TaxID=3062634 RepID=UPI0026E1DDEC|nr:HAMP domain-containing sensor histidine kinase [Agarivorans sp. 1_MG-2023]MDO6765936.1 HAMP domain-containing sensor histidine kinase [Agarivorans sp. 1_MG-2023]
MINFRALVSIRRLSFWALATLGLPLLLSLSLASYYLQQVSMQGQHTAFLAAKVVSGSKRIDESLLDLERSARQFRVVADQNLLKLYRRQWQRVSRALIEQRENTEDPDLLAIVAELQQQLQSLQELMERPQPLQKIALNQQFSRFTELSRDFDLRSQTLINELAMDLQNNTQQAQQRLLLSMISLPFALAAAVLLVLVITRPLQQLRPQIARLKSGEFDQAIKVSGATEVMAIADALDDMRLRLLSLEQQKTAFIRHISHELKTPLAAIREGNELLYDNSAGPLNPQQQEITEILRESSLRLQQLIEALLDFNLLLDTPGEQVHHPVDLKPLMEKVLATHRLSLSSRQLQVKLELSQAAVLANQEQLRVIIDNLLSNAIKFSPEGGLIKLGAFSTVSGVSVYIDDQGEGIDEELQQRIFQPFVQGKSAKDPRLKGSGLGLTIAKELVERQHANLNYQRLDKGSRFVVEGLQGSELDES